MQRPVSCSSCGFVLSHGETTAPERGECPACGAVIAPQAAAPAAAGEGPEVWGDYEIVSEIARGGMGVVYRARQRSLGREVALKILRPEVADRGMALERFRREANLVARLRHPGIVAVHEAGEREGMHYYSMDLIDGRPLDEVLARDRPGWAESLRLMVQVARAVEHAHRHGVVHRDLKPANVLVDRAGNALVTDFGLAKFFADEEGEAPGTLTVTGATMGTPYYMSPEQAAGRSREVDARSDVFSLGTMLYEMLAGRRPFDGRSRNELFAAIAEADPVPLRRLRPDVPADLEVACLHALEKAPERRYLSAGELADDLDRVRRGEPVHARPRSRARRLAGKVLRHRHAWAILAGVLAFGSGLVALVSTGDEAEHPSIPPPLATDPEPAIRPPAPAMEWQEVFADGFDRDSIGPDWVELAGEWRIRDGVLVGSGFDNAGIRYAAPLTDDVMLEYRARMVPRRVVCDLSAFLLGDEERPWDTGYFFGFGTNWNERSNLLRQRANVRDSFDVRIVPGQWHRVRASRVGRTIALEIDGKVLLSHQDLFPLHGPDRAHLGLYTFDSEAEFDDVRVYRGAMPASATPLSVADDLYRHELFDQALEIYRAAGGDEARLKAALCLWRKGAIQDALAAVRELPGSIPDPLLEAEVRYAECRILEQAEGWRAALQFIHERCQADPGSPAARLLESDLQRRGEANERKGNRTVAIACYREALDRASCEPSRRVWLELHLGICQTQAKGRNQRSEGLELLKGLPEKYPEHPVESAWALFYAGQFLVQTGDAAGGLPLFEEVVARYGSEAPVVAAFALDAIASVHAKAGRVEEAIAALVRLDTEFGDASRYYRLAALERLLALAAGAGRIDLAVAASDRLIESLPYEREACAKGLLASGDALAAAGRAEEAAARFRRVLEEFADQKAECEKASRRLR